MKTYQCFKRVQAFKILGGVSSDPAGPHILRGEGGFSLVVPSEYVIRHEPKIGGYYVRYSDGYESFSPAATFEAGYIEVVQ